MGKGLNPGYQPGNHWVICDRCGFAYRNSEVRKTWDGLVVCKEDWEPRHPQDLLRGREDRVAPQGHVRPDPASGSGGSVPFDSSGNIPTVTGGSAPSGDLFVEDPGFQDKTGDDDYTVPSGTF